jgi:hypothetical protein
MKTESARNKRKVGILVTNMITVEALGGIAVVVVEAVLDLMVHSLLQHGLQAVLRHHHCRRNELYKYKRVRC